MSPNIKLEWVRPPLQARSQQTLERLLDAAESIIEQKGLDNATVAEVARCAGSSVGAFYSRFKDKEGLLRCVFERFNQQALATADAALEPTRWKGVRLHDAVEIMVRFLLRMLTDRRGVVTAMFSRTATNPEVTALGQLLHERIVAAMLTLIEHRGYRLAHPDPTVAVEVAVWLVLSGLQARVVHGASQEHTLSAERAAQEIARLCSSYLGIEETSSDHLVAIHTNPTQSTLSTQ